jgi:hypothetical protein
MSPSPRRTSFRFWARGRARNNCGGSGTATAPRALEHLRPLFWRLAQAKRQLLPEQRGIRLPAGLNFRIRRGSGATARNGSVPSTGDGRVRPPRRGTSTSSLAILAYTILLPIPTVDQTGRETDPAEMEFARSGSP